MVMTDDLELRASDADRDRAAAVLGGALASGRLTSAEYAERLDSVYVAKTLGELVPLTRDLPADDASDSGLSAAARTEVAASFSKVIRSGRWVAARHTRLTSHFGALFAKRAIYGRENSAGADGPVIRIVGDARFSKVAVHRGRFDRSGPWRHETA
jgi:hypothetical protein